MRVVWQLVAVTAIAVLGGQAVTAVQDDPWLTLVLGALTAVVAVPVYGWVVRRTERRPSTEVAIEGAGVKLGLGTAAGVALFGLVIVNIAFLGFYDVEGLGTLTGALGLIGLMAAASVTEELLFRGVVQRVIEERTGTWISLALTSALFGLVHLLNPNASLWGAVAIAMSGGVMLGAAYIATRNLWVPIGLHFGWNFAASGLFSTEVSGNGTPQGLLDAATSGPTLVSGGEFGPEGSLYTVLFCGLTAIGFLWLAKRRGHLVPRRRRTANADTAATLPR